MFVRSVEQKERHCTGASEWGIEILPRVKTVSVHGVVLYCYFLIGLKRWIATKVQFKAKKLFKTVQNVFYILTISRVILFYIFSHVGWNCFFFYTYFDCYKRTGCANWIVSKNRLNTRGKTKKGSIHKSTITISS